MAFNLIILLIINAMIMAVSYGFGKYKGYGKGFDDAFNYIVEYLQGMELDKTSEEVKANVRHK